jgi:hypothetical protein
VSRGEPHLPLRCAIRSGSSRSAGERTRGCGARRLAAVSCAGTWGNYPGRGVQGAAGLILPPGRRRTATANAIVPPLLEGRLMDCRCPSPGADPPRGRVDQAAASATGRTAAHLGRQRANPGHCRIPRDPAGHSLSPPDRVDGDRRLRSRTGRRPCGRVAFRSDAAVGDVADVRRGILTEPDRRVASMRSQGQESDCSRSGGA